MTKALTAFIDLMNRAFQARTNFHCSHDRGIAYSKGKENRVIHLRILSLTLQDNKEYVKFSVCEFWRRQVTFYGYVITTEGVLVDFQGTEVIRKWKQHIKISKVCERFQEVKR